MTRRGPKDACRGSWYEAKANVWKEYSQSWSAAPRADQGRFVMFMLAAGEVDMARMAVVVVGLRKEERVARRGVKIATARAITAIREAKAFVKKMAVVTVECCWSLSVVLVSGIRRDRNQLHRPRAWFIYTWLVEWLVRGSCRRFYCCIISLFALCNAVSGFTESSTPSMRPRLRSAE